MIIAPCTFPRFFLIFFLLFQVSYAAAPQENNKELSKIKLELKETLHEKHAVQKKLNSLKIENNNSITNKNNGFVKTAYDSRINNLTEQRNKLLLRYTKKHPEVKAVERAIKELEARRLVKIKSILESSGDTPDALEKNLVYQDLKKTLRTLNQKIGTLNIRLLENQKRYNDYHKPGHITEVKSRKFEHPGGLHSILQIDIARKKIAAHDQPWFAAFKVLIQQAKNSLGKSSEAIEDFNVPGYYMDAKGNRKVLQRLSNDAWVAYSSAVAYQLSSGNERIQYAEKAIQILESWATINKKTSSYDGDLSMVTAGSGLIFAAELMSDYNGWKKSQRKGFKIWLTTVYLKSCKKISKKSNNWRDWGILGSIASHYFLDDVYALDADIENLRKKIDDTILSDGSIPHEAKRGKNGLWYTYFSLAPLTSASQIALNARNVDLFHYKSIDGAGIEEALDYLFRYSLKPEKWPYSRRKDLNIPKPKRWPGNLFEAMYGIYGKEEYNNWIKDARPIMIYEHHYAWAVPTLLRTMPPHNNIHE